MAALASIPPTERLYLPSLEGNFIYTSTATLLKLTKTFPVDDAELPEAGATLLKVDMVFDKSPFHPQGGGQPTDLGQIRSTSTPSIVFTVDKVSFSFEDKVVTHHCSTTSVDVATASPLPAPGAEFSLEVDEEHRKNMSAFHSAGHLVDSAIYSLGYGGLIPQKGYHFTDGPYVEYAGGKSVAEDERKTLVPRLNEKFCQLIADDIPTTICMQQKEEAEADLNRETKGAFDRKDPFGGDAHTTLTLL